MWQKETEKFYEHLDLADIKINQLRIEKEVSLMHYFNNGKPTCGFCES